MRSGREEGCQWPFWENCPNSIRTIEGEVGGDSESVASAEKPCAVSHQRTTRSLARNILSTVYLRPALGVSVQKKGEKDPFPHREPHYGVHFPKTAFSLALSCFSGSSSSVTCSEMPSLITRM